MNNNIVAPARPNLLMTKPVNTSFQEAALAPDPIALIPNLWNEGEVACVFASTNIGKSIYALQVSAEIAKSRKVLYFDGEMSDKQVQNRYTNKETKEIHVFPENLLRTVISSDAPYVENFHDALLDSIEIVAAEHEVNVIVLDNMSVFCMNAEKADEAGRFMFRLKQLQARHGWSILVVAHTPKIPEYTHLELNHLAGSSRLAYFFDDIFALGRSRRGRNIRYLIQLKYRAEDFTHGENNVQVLEIVKEPDGNTILEYQGCSTEQEHLYPSESFNRTSEIYALRDQGKSTREIAKELEMSKSTVNRRLQERYAQKTAVIEDNHETCTCFVIQSSEAARATS